MATYTEPKLINTYELSNQLNPTISELSNGNLLISWFSWYQDGSNYGVYGQIVTPELEFIGSEFQLNEYTTGNQYHQTIIPHENGGFYGLWYSSQYAGMDLREFDSFGNPVGPETHTGIKSSSNVPLGIGDNLLSVSTDALTVSTVWLQPNSVGRDAVHYGTLNLNDSSYSLIYTDDPMTNMRSTDPHLLSLSNGFSAIGFSEYMADGSGYAAQVVIIDEEGLVSTNKSTVNTTVVGDQYLTDLIAINDNEFGAIWSTEDDHSVMHIYNSVDGSLVSEISLEYVDTFGTARKPIDCFQSDDQLFSFLMIDGSVLHYDHSTKETRLDRITPDTLPFISDAILLDENTLMATWSLGHEMADIDGYGIQAAKISISPNLPTLLVSVQTRSDAPIDNVTLSGTEATTLVSATEMQYQVEIEPSITSLVFNKDFDEIAQKSISSADALDALRLSVGLDTTSGTSSAYDFISADVNQDGKVSSVDALDILKYSVGLPIETPPKWVFLDSRSDLSSINKSNVNYDTAYDTSNITPDLTLDMVGILLGDVNDTFSASVVIA